MSHYRGTKLAASVKGPKRVLTEQKNQGMEVGTVSTSKFQNFTVP